MASIGMTRKLASISGSGLTVEERAGLQVGMLRRKNEEGLMRILFWGKVSGTDNDYLVCVGYLPSKAGALNKKWYFATSNNLVLQAMPELSAEFAGKAAAIGSRFKGDPSLLLGGEEEDEDKGDDEEEEGAPRPPKFSEMHRLAYVVQSIDDDTAVVPRGALLIDATRTVRPNRAFGGLSLSEAGSLENYQHLRNSSKADLDSASTGITACDFLDSIADDEPKGVWAIRTDAASGTATLRSLKWPGYFFYHKAGTADYAAAYFGSGLANNDLGFML